MKTSSTPLNLEHHIRQIREEGERRILASTVLARCASASHTYEYETVHSQGGARQGGRYSGFVLLQLAKTLAHMQHE